MTSKLNHISLAFVTLLSLGGCATKPVEPAPNPDAELNAKLVGFADRATLSMQRLAALRSASAGLVVQDVTAPQGLEVPLSLTWSGPIEALAKKVAEMTGYTFEANLGNSPATPVLVSLSVRNTTAFNILADAGAQAGSAADIIIRPDSKKIFVKFPPVTKTGGYALVPSDSARKPSAASALPAQAPK